MHGSTLSPQQPCNRVRRSSQNRCYSVLKFLPREVAALSLWRSVQGVHANEHKAEVPVADSWSLPPLLHRSLGRGGCAIKLLLRNQTGQEFPVSMA